MSGKRLRPPSTQRPNSAPIAVSSPVPSPCIRHCTLDETDICVGCYRSLDEILQWSDASNAQRLKILEQTIIRSKNYPGW